MIQRINTMLVLALTMVFCGHQEISAQVIDTFSGNLSAYTATRILNNANHSPTNTAAWAINGGSLQFETTAYVGIEQFALTRTDFPLNIGFELQVDYAPTNPGSQDIGLALFGATPTVDVRANYINVYVRNGGAQILSRGFDGTTELSQIGPLTPTGLTSLFIARTGAATFDLGYYSGATRNVMVSRTISNGNSANIGNVIGFYADVRAQGIVGNVDNLRIAAVPEPSMALMLWGGLAILGGQRRRRL